LLVKSQIEKSNMGLAASRVVDGSDEEEGKKKHEVRLKLPSFLGVISWRPSR
jgi:hypothetical protein